MTLFISPSSPNILVNKKPVVDCCSIQIDNKEYDVIIYDIAAYIAN
jgi:hypothetical protein